MFFPCQNLTKLIVKQKHWNVETEKFRHESQKRFQNRFDNSQGLFLDANLLSPRSVISISFSSDETLMTSRCSDIALAFCPNNERRNSDTPIKNFESVRPGAFP